MTRSTSFSSIISMITQHSPVRSEYNPFPFPLSGPNLSLGLSNCSSAVKLVSIDLLTDVVSFARSCFAAGEITTVNLLKGVPKLMHYFCKCLTFSRFEILSRLCHSLKSLIAYRFGIDLSFENSDDDFFVRFIWSIFQKGNFLICFIAQRNRDCHTILLFLRRHMHSHTGAE